MLVLCACLQMLKITLDFVATVFLQLRLRFVIVLLQQNNHCTQTFSYWVFNLFLYPSVVPYWFTSWSSERMRAFFPFAQGRVDLRQADRLYVIRILTSSHKAQRVRREGPCRSRYLCFFNLSLYEVLNWHPMVEFFRKFLFLMAQIKSCCSKWENKLR